MGYEQVMDEKVSYEVNQQTGKVLQFNYSTGITNTVKNPTQSIPKRHQEIMALLDMATPLQPNKRGTGPEIEADGYRHWVWIPIRYGPTDPREVIKDYVLFRKKAHDN